MSISENFRRAVDQMNATPPPPAPALVRQEKKGNGRYWVTGITVVIVLACGGGLVGGIIASLVAWGLVSLFTRKS
jgi:hypothetical protein